MKQLIDDIDAHFEASKETLIGLLKIPSVSTAPEHKTDVVHACEYLRGMLESMGMENVTVHSTKGHPILTAEHCKQQGKPTVLVYGHYDVQPSDPDNEWLTPPFDPVIKGDRIYARGASDDKGQLLTHVLALESYFRTGTPLPVNVKILLEGEEEIGSPNLVPFLEANKEWAACDMVVVSDTAMFSEDKPSITVGLRGLAYMEVRVKGAKRDLHSGVFGGAAPNPANILAEMITKLKDENGRILIPGFYDSVRDLTPAERQAYSELPFDEKAYKEAIGIRDVVGEEEYSILERVSARPTLDVNGLWSGYQGEGAKTVLPAKAGAKISMRLVPDQDPHTIAALFKAYIEKIAPDSVEVEVEDHHGGYPIVVDLDFDGIRAAADAFKDVYGSDVYFTREGGSIPIIAEFKRILGANSVLMGFGLTEDGLHSPNESFSLKDFGRGIKVSATFFAKLGGIA